MKKRVGFKGKKPILLFLSWRDFEHPQSGGAEVFTTEMLNRSGLKDQYQVIHYSTQPKQAPRVSRHQNIIYLRMGNWISVILHAMIFYFNNYARVRFVVDQCNTHRFFTPIWVERSRRIFFIHQLTRDIWRLKLPFPMSLIGELAEDLMLKIYRDSDTMTVSDSTRRDLKSIGFQDNRVHIIPEGVGHEPVKLPLMDKKSKKVFLYVGRYSEYKGLNDATKAFVELLKDEPESQFIVIGKRIQIYIDRFLKPICEENNITIANSYCAKAKRTIFLLGRVSEDIKLKYMKEAAAILYPSQREGWGLTVSEAAILGTPSIVYDSPGLIDAVNKGAAGYLCEENSHFEILKHMKNLISDDVEYEDTRLRAYHYSSTFRWDNTASAFDRFIRGKQNV